MNQQTFPVSEPLREAIQQLLDARRDACGCCPVDQEFFDAVERLLAPKEK